MARVLAVGRALPDHYYDQETLIEAFKRVWGAQFFNPARLEQLHRNVLVGGRHLALPLQAYEQLDSFRSANDAYVRCAVDVGERALRDGLAASGLSPSDVDHLFFVSVTGLATPSIDARLVNRLRLRQDIKRTPIFGLGCVAGAAGVARAADYLRAFDDQVAVLLSVELCSLTLQRRDLSIANMIASGLFGDGAAAAVLVGARHPLARAEPRAEGEKARQAGPVVLATRSVFYPDTEQVMGWDVTSEGFRVVLSAAVPDVVGRHARRDVDAFLADNALAIEDIESYVCHPGGPKVLQAFQATLGLDDDALALTWASLKRVGNLSSASVLMVLADTIAERRPRRGSLGLMLAMGPGFCSELVLLRW